MLDPQCAQSSVVSPNRSIGAETHYGIASKCSRYLGVWRERRLLLTPATLSQPPTLRTFRAPPEGANAQPTETLSLAGASVLTCPRQLAPRRFADDAAHFFVVVTAESERGVFFCVPSELLAREWVAAISRCVSGKEEESVASPAACEPSNLSATCGPSTPSAASGPSTPSAAWQSGPSTHSATGGPSTPSAASGPSIPSAASMLASVEDDEDSATPSTAGVRVFFRAWRLCAATAAEQRRRVLRGQPMEAAHAQRRALHALASHRAFRRLSELASATSPTRTLSQCLRHWRSLSKVLRPLRELEARNADLADWVGQLQGTLRAVAIERRLEELLDMEADIEAQMDIADVKDGLDTRATLESDLCAVRAEVEQLRQVIELTPAIAQPLDQDDSYEAFGAEQAENAYVDFVPFSSARKSSRPATPDDSTRSSEKLKKLDSKNEMKATPKQESLNVCASASPTPSEPTVGVSRDSAGLSSPWWKSLFRVHGFDEVLS